MDPWKMFGEMCRQVVENGNVYLDVTIFDGHAEMTLWPYDKTMSGEDDEEDD